MKKRRHNYAERGEIMNLDKENLQKWLNGEYVSPQDFKDSLKMVISQFEQHEKVVNFIKPHVENTIRRLNGGQTVGTIPFSDLGFVKQLDKMLKG